MKRLLAYLFIVLGLGLILSDDSNAEIKKNLIFCINTGYPSATDVYIKQQLEYNKTFKSPDICSSNQSSLVEIGYNEWKKRFRSSRFYLRRDGDSICVSPPYNCDGNGNTRIEHTGENFYKDYKNKKTQVAKVEPSEKQKVAKKNSSTAFVYLKTSDVINFGFRVEIADLDILFLDNGKCKVDISLFYIFENYNQRNNCFWTVVEDDKKISVEYDFYGVKRNYIFYKDNVNNVGDILAYRPPKNKAYKIYPYDKSYPLKLALKFNVKSFIDNNSYDDININQTNISAPN